VAVTALLGIQSGGAPLVMSLQAADIRKLDDLPARWRLHGTMVRRIHLKRLMNAPSMVEIDVGPENAAQVPLVKDNDVVKALAAKGADYPLRNKETLLFFPESNVIVIGASKG